MNRKDRSYHIFIEKTNAEFSSLKLYNKSINFKRSGVFVAELLNREFILFVSPLNMRINVMLILDVVEKYILSLQTYLMNNLLRSNDDKVPKY